MSHDTTLSRVVGCLASVTRYPEQLLTPGADLENDLGIDSVKLVEIVIAISEEFKIELRNEDRDPSIRTIEQLAVWVDGFLTPEASPKAPATEMPAAVQSPPPTVAAPSAYHPGHPTGGAPVAPQHFQAVPSIPPAQPIVAQQPASSLEPKTNGRPLAGRVALVTGSGRGVGRVTARLLAQRGATVLVNSFHSREDGEQTVAEINASGGTAHHLWGSVANPKHVDELFDRIEREFGLDILVCNASDGRIGAFADLSSDDWDRAFRTNVTGHYLCAMRASRIMRSRGGGAIVTMSAVGAHQYIKGLGSQGVAKAAVESLTRYMACELGSSGIRVNCVCGGPVYGELLDKFPSAKSSQHHWESMIPDGQLTSPTDIAEAIGFLVSDVARGINGAVVMVDHGFSANADGQKLHEASVESFRPASFGMNPVLTRV